MYHNGEWGTVCDDEWDLNDAEVVCTELGYGPAIAARYYAFSGQASGEIWLDEVNCVGTEVTIANCSHGGWGNHDCIHAEDAGVRCAGSSGMLFNCLSYIQFSVFFVCFTAVVVIRLVNDDTEGYEGRVEVYYNGTWGIVCDDGWDFNDAEVLCRELGYGSAINAKSEEFYGQGSGIIWLSGLNCTGTESSIVNCSHSGWGMNDCNHSSNAGVRCAAPNGNVLLQFMYLHLSMYNYFISVVKVRLVNGPTEYQGRVEVYYNGEWGTVCSLQWDLNDAAVVCRQLGHGPAVEVTYYGSANGRIWLHYVDCDGTESNIGNCSHGGWGRNVCDHEEDVGVRCADSNGMQFYIP